MSKALKKEKDYEEQLLSDHYHHMQIKINKLLEENKKLK